MADKLGILWSPEAYAEYKRLKRKVDTLRGDGVVNTPDSIVIQRSDGATLQKRIKPNLGPGGVAPPGLFPVTVTQDGGSAGSGTTACTFTYAVMDENGTTLGTGVTPRMQRPALGKTTAAAIGMAYYRDGEVRLQWCDEVDDVVERSCP